MSSGDEKGAICGKFPYVRNLEKEHGRIILSKTLMPKADTLEYLFKDYSGGSFKTELIDLGEPAGDEQW